MHRLKSLGMWLVLPRPRGLHFMGVPVPTWLQQHPIWIRRTSRELPRRHAGLFAGTESALFCGESMREARGRKSAVSAWANAHCCVCTQAVAGGGAAKRDCSRHEAPARRGSLSTSRARALPVAALSCTWFCCARGAAHCLRGGGDHQVKQRLNERSEARNTVTQMRPQSFLRTPAPSKLSGDAQVSSASPSLPHFVRRGSAALRRLGALRAM